MTSAERVALLRRTQFFRDASERTLAAIADACDEISAGVGAVVIEHGATGDGMYCLADGELEVFVGGATLDRIVPGDCFGEVALVTESPRTASVRVTKTARMLFLSRGEFRELLKRDPDIALGAFRELTTKVKSAIDVRVRQHESLVRLRDAFERSVSKGVMDEILASPEPLALMEGKETRATIVFADIRGFTSIAEGLTPRDTIHYLNAYLGALVDLVFHAGGTIDKFIGDAIMAHFGAPLSRPDDAKNAVDCALAMPETLARADAVRAIKDAHAPTIGVGIATGNVVAGCVGNARRMDYTVIGDAVNLASRIEGLTKAYGCRLLLCGETARALAGCVPLRLVDSVRVKGKTRATELYDVPGAPALADAYRSAFAMYEEGRFDAAARAFAEMAREHPEDGPARVLAERCGSFARTPPGDPWDGIFALQSK